MLRLAVLIFFSAAVLGSVAQSHDFSWLEGCWVSPDRSAQEVWVKESEQSLMGFAVEVNDGAVQSYELLRLQLDKDGHWIYTAYPAGQASASFRAIMIRKDSAVFANAGHDYPQEIRYERHGDQLSASISLMDGINSRSFDKIACD